MPHIRTTHVGSMPRPPELLALMVRRENGDAVDLEEIEALATEAVKATTRRQRQVGLDIVNDGEAGKLSYAHYVRHRFNGVGAAASAPADSVMEGEFRRYPGWAKEEAAREAAMVASLSVKAYECNGPLTMKDMGPLHADLRRLRTAAAEADANDVFMNAASPGVLTYFIANKYYPTREEYLAALVDVLKPEYEAIVDAGFILQIDCPDLSLNCIGGISEAERDALKMQSVDAINAATADIDPARMRLHLCWGNYEGPHDHDLPLSAVLPFACLARPAGISFEGANPRHEHEWALFDEISLPDDKIAIPGVINNKTTFIEHPEVVAQRIARFVQRLGADRVIASVDCGFASHALVTYDPEIAYKKLESLVEGAAIAGKRVR